MGYETGRRQKAKGPVTKMRQYEVRGAEKPTFKWERKGRDGILMPDTQLSKYYGVMWSAGECRLPERAEGVLPESVLSAFTLGVVKVSVGCWFCVWCVACPLLFIFQ